MSHKNKRKKHLKFDDLEEVFGTTNCPSDSTSHAAPDYDEEKGGVAVPPEFSNTGKDHTLDYGEGTQADTMPPRLSDWFDLRDEGEPSHKKARLEEEIIESVEPKDEQVGCDRPRHTTDSIYPSLIIQTTQISALPALTDTAPLTSRQRNVDRYNEITEENWLPLWAMYFAKRTYTEWQKAL